MRKVLVVLGVAVVLGWMLLPAAPGQEVVGAKSSKLTIGGTLIFDGVYRDDGIFDDAVVSAVAATPYPFGGTAWVSTDLSIDLGLDFTQNVSAFIQLRTDWKSEEIGDDFGSCISLQSGVNYWAEDDLGLEVEQAYIDVVEFLDPAMSLRMGIQPLAWDLRGNGDELFLNVDEGFAGEAGGFCAMYDADPVMLTAFAGTIVETLSDKQDVALYAVRGVYPFEDDMSTVAVGVACVDLDSHKMLAADVGVDYFLNEDTELYGEAVFEFGEIAQDVDAAGWGGYVGGKYTASDYEYTPSIDLSYWYLSGDDDAADTDEENYISMEDVDTFAIIEENHYGYDIDSNFWGVKLVADARPAEDVTVCLKGGYFVLNEVASGEADDLGTEIDGSITWEYSENLTFTAQAAYIMGSDVLEAATPDEEDSGFLLSLGTKLVF